MSIKGFHLIFISIAAIFFAALGVWALFIDEKETALTSSILGGVGFFFSVALICYGIYFRKKSKDIIV